MPLKGIPNSLTPDLLYAIAKMGHGDQLVISDGNFPGDSVASHCVVKTPIRVHGTTSQILKDILQLFPLDEYEDFPVTVMDRVQSDKDKGFVVKAYDLITEAAELQSTPEKIFYCERSQFYDKAKKSYAVVQTDDSAPYANIIIFKGVLVTP